MEETNKNFLEQLRSLDESIKRKILIVASLVVLVVIAYVWLSYFNGLVAAASPAATTNSGVAINANGANVNATTGDDASGAVATNSGQASSTGSSTSFNLLASVANGFAMIGSWFTRIAQIVQGPGQYTIQPR